jgi:hypothetical protein
MTMTFGAPVDCATLAVASSVPSAQLVSVTVPAVVLIVIVPAAVQFQFGEVLKLSFQSVASTFTEGGTDTFVHDETHAALTQVWFEPHACAQDPQFAESVCSFTHAPVHAL